MTRVAMDYLNTAKEMIRSGSLKVAVVYAIIDIAYSLRTIAGQRNSNGDEVDFNELGGALWRAAHLSPGVNGGVDFHEVARKVLCEYSVQSKLITGG